MEQLQAIKGMNDILPPGSATWEWVEDRVRHLMARYAYRNIRTPIVEMTALFVRGLGEVTDVVEKEMYSFVDSMNGDRLSLRPENTAGVVRAMVQSNLLYDGPRRLFYMGPMFRHEKPQRGRYRQFHQIGAEALGFAGPDVDAELILMAQALWRELGIAQHVQLELNSLGQPDERSKHREALIAYFEANKDILDEDGQRRLYTNPLRILDTKNPKMQDLVNNAPQLMDYLGDASRAHFEGVKAILDANGIAWTLNPRLVRGLDYYNLTVFEFVTTKLGSQGTICGGGRYDYLFEMVGAKSVPAVGWAIGVERVLELVAELNCAPCEPVADVYAIIPDMAAWPMAVPVLEQLRTLGVAVQMHAATESGLGKMKAQFKKADASGARYALIFGESELAAQQVTIKSLRDGQGRQWMRSLTEIAAWYHEVLDAS